MDMLSDSNKWPVIQFGALASCFGLPSRSLTWNLKMAPWNRRFLLETIICRFHVKLGEYKPDLFSPVSLPLLKRPSNFPHQKFRIPKMQVLKLIRQFQSWVFPYIKPYPYSLYRFSDSSILGTNEMFGTHLCP